MKAAKALLIPGIAMAGVGLMCAGAAAAGLCICASRRGFRGMRGKVVVITGGSRGLGLAMAEEFGQRGAKLVLAARNRDELERAKKHLVRRRTVESENDVLTVSVDLRRAEDGELLMAEATRRFGQVDVLVNNAGAINVAPIENQRVEDFHGAMDSNFFSGLHCTLAVLPQMLERRGGSIVNISSVGGKVAVPHLLPYTASKFAVAGFSQGLNAELRAKGVHVLTVCPGLMRTGSHGSAEFGGDAAREYQWFSLAANLPVISASASSAAKRIVRAVIARETEIAITPQAMLAARLGQVAPEVTVRVMAMMNRLLPPAALESELPRPGTEVRGRERMPARWIGGAAARRYNQSI